MRFRFLLFTLLLCSAGAAPLAPGLLLADLSSVPEISLAGQKLALAQSRVQQDDAWQITASGDSSLEGNAAKTSLGAAASLSVQHRGPQALDDARLGRILTLRRAEFAVYKAQLTELRRRVNAWHALRLAQQALQTASLGQQAAGLTVQTTGARAVQGTANQAQVENARLALQRAELGVRQATQPLAQARAELNLPGVEGTQAEAGEWMPLPQPNIPNIRQREDLLEASLSVTEAQTVMQRETQNALPNVQVTGGLNQGHFSLSADLDRQLNTTLSASARLNPVPASWNLGLKGNFRLDGAARRVVESARLTFEQAKVTLQSTQARAGRDVQQKRQGVLTARDTLTLAEAQQRAAQDNARTATERLGQGLIGPADELNARIEAARAQEALFTAQRNLDTATLELWEALGWVP